MAISDPGSERDCAWRLLSQLETPENRILRPGLDAGEVQDVDNDQEEAKDTSDHDQTPRHLVRTSILLPCGPDFRMRINAEANQGDGESCANDPVEHWGQSSEPLGVCGVFAQKEGCFARDQMARYAAIERSGQ